MVKQLETFPPTKKWFVIMLFQLFFFLKSHEPPLMFLFCFTVFAMLGMLSPASRGALMTSGIFLYVFMGLIAGYVSARLYKTIKGRKWKRAAFLVSFKFGLIIFFNNQTRVTIDLKIIFRVCSASTIK